MRENEGNTSRIQKEKGKKKYKMTRDGKMQTLYTGEEMKVIDGKMTPEKTRQ